MDLNGILKLNWSLTNWLLDIIILIFHMGKEAKSEIMGKVYREISRQKYNKYKAQFPKLRES